MAEHALYGRSHAQANPVNSMFMEMKEELLTEIRHIEAELKKGKMSSWYIIQLLLDKLNGMANVLKNGLGAYQQAIEKVSGDYQKMLAAMKRIEADQAQGKSVDADTKAFADAYKKLETDLYKGTDGKGTIDKPGKGSLLYIANNSNNPDWKQTAADAKATWNMIGTTNIPSGGTVASAIDSGDLTDLDTAFTAFAKQYNDAQASGKPSDKPGPFGDWESGKGEAEGLDNLTQDLSSDITDANNKLNQDAQIINSCNSIAQSGVKNTTDMYSFLVQHQTANG